MKSGGGGRGGRPAPAAYTLFISTHELVKYSSLAKSRKDPPGLLAKAARCNSSGANI